MMADRTGVLDLEATGGVGGRNVEHHGIPTPLLPLERQILQEAEVTTPPRGGAHRPGCHQAPEPQLPPPDGHEQCLRFLRTSGQGTSGQTDGMMPGHLEMCWLSELRTGCCEHRGFHLWCVPLDRRRSQRRKCHGLVGRPVGKSTDRFLTQ